MNLSLPPAAADFARSAERALAAAGGRDLHRQAVLDPDLRTTVVAPLLDRLGLGDLDVRTDEETRLAGAELCRVAGSMALPYPVVALLGRPPEADPSVRVAVASAPLGPGPQGSAPQWADHGDLGNWLVVDAEGRIGEGVARPVEGNRTLGPFVAPLEVIPGAGRGQGRDWALVVILDAWRVLGVVEAAQEMTTEHVRDRHQFGRPLAAQQGVQFHVADNEVAVRGLRQLCWYTLWRWAADGRHHRTDALALRVVALEAAQSVLRTCHLLHGAVGFCEEHDLTVLSRSVAPSIRLPWDLEVTSEELARSIDAEGFDGLFSPAEPCVAQRSTP